MVPAHEVLGAAALLVEPYSAVLSGQLWQKHAQGLESAGAHQRWRELAAQPLPAVAARISPVRRPTTQAGAK